MSTENKVHITGNYYYKADDNQYTLLECGTRHKIDRKTRKTTDELIDYEDQIGYYTTLSSLLTGCVTHANRRATSDGEFKELTDSIKHIEKIYSEINDMVLI